MGRAWIASSERVAPWVAGFVLAVPVLIVRYPPMADLAMHEAVVSVLRHLGDPRWAPPGLYAAVIPQANQLFQLTALALSLVLPTDLACKVLVCALVLATPPLGARLLGRLGLSRWLSLLLGPIACGWMFRWGLVANLCGFVLLLALVPLLERAARRPSAKVAAWVSASAGLLFFAHESSALLFAVIAAGFTLVRAREWRALAAGLAPLVVVLVLGVVQWRVSEGLESANMRAIGTELGAGPLERLAILPGAMFGGLAPLRLALVGTVWFAALVSSAASRPSTRSLPLRVALWRHRYAVLAVVFFLLYLGSPMEIGGATLIAHRFVPGACLCLVLACAARRTPLLCVMLSGAAPLLFLGVEARDFLDADARYRALDRIIALVPQDVAVAQLDLTPRAPGHVAPIPGSASRVLAERGGRMLFALTDTPPNPVTIPAPLRWTEPIARLVRTPYAFMPSYDLARFSYLLERNQSAPARAEVARALAPEAELLATEGEWSLFRSRLVVAPLTAPDQPLPVPAPETLGHRLRSR